MHTCGAPHPTPSPCLLPACRVHTLALPVVSDLIELYKAGDAGGTAALLAKVSVERSYSAKLDDVRTGVSHSPSGGLAAQG